MKFEIDIKAAGGSPYADEFIGEVIRSRKYRVVVHFENQGWEIQKRPSAQPFNGWQHMAFNRSLKAISTLWLGLHGSCARHCWPELAYLPALFGGAG